MRHLLTDPDRREDVSCALSFGTWSSRLLASVTAFALAALPAQAGAWAPAQTQTQGAATTASPESGAPPAEAPTEPVAPAEGSPESGAPPADVAPPAEPAPPAESAPAAEPAPAPEPAPEVAPAPAPEPVGPPPPPAPTPTVKDLKKAESLRRGGVYTMATGGVIAGIGLGVMVGYTIAGRRLSNDLILAEEMVNEADCAYKNSAMCETLDAKVTGLRDRRESANMATQVAGVTFAAGLLVIGIGGAIYRAGIRKMKRGADLARVRVAPTLGGAVISGRF